jgi:hypothetical protein
MIKARFTTIEKRVDHWLPWICLVVCAGTLFSLTNKYAVNVLYWDEWDTFLAYFKGESLWNQFAWQHGPHRMGVGGVVVGVLNDLTAWNSRVIGFAGVGFLVLAAVLALELKRKLSGPIQWTDLVLPLSLLTYTQIDGIVIDQYLAQGILPKVLLFGYCLCWTMSFSIAQIVSIAVLQFCLWFTGYGLTFVPVCALILGMNLVSKKPRFSGRETWILLGTMAVSGALFFHNYKFGPAEKDLALGGGPTLALFAQFQWSLGAAFCGLADSSLGAVVGYLYLAALAVVFALAVNRLAWKMAPCDIAIAILTGATITFMLACALGRTFNGVGTSGRYMTFVGMGFVGLYFQLCKIRAQTREGMAIVFAALFLHGSFRVLTLPESAWHTTSVKRQWADCYLENQDAAACTHAVGTGIYPNMNAIQSRLEYLRRYRLNIFNRWVGPSLQTN